MVDAVKSVVEGAFVGNFDPNYYHSDKKDQKIDELTVVIPANSDQKQLQSALEVGRIIGEAQNFTRDLVNEPGNRMTPTILADRAKKMCDEVGLKCEVFGPDKIKELKMGAFWSVSQGSDEEPRMIIMRYEPQGAPEKPVLGLVGKGITFDSGGMCIKPSSKMWEMKGDMSGAAAVLCAMDQIAREKLPIRVTAVVVTAQNYIDKRATMPGDVFQAKNGKFVHVDNTDAEGRLILIDGLWRMGEAKVTHLVDIATLTGACVRALGTSVSGVLGNDEFADEVARVAGAQGEP
jgi:leucyl aminopeptidase